MPDSGRVHVCPYCRRNGGEDGRCSHCGREYGDWRPSDSPCSSGDPFRRKDPIRVPDEGRLVFYSNVPLDGDEERLSVDLRSRAQAKVFFYLRCGTRDCWVFDDADRQRARAGALSRGARRRAAQRIPRREGCRVVCHEPRADVYALLCVVAARRVDATALRCGRPERRAFHLNALSRPVRQKALCASAAIPIVFPPVEIDGVLWQDGGWVERGGDKTPIDPILENHPDVTTVVVYLLDQAHLPAGGREAIRRKAAARRVRLVEIVPTENIGGDLNGWSGVFDTSEETARHLATCGRQDALTALRALASERETGGKGTLQP